VSAHVSADRRDEVLRPYSEAIAGGLPPEIRQTFLLVGEDDTIAVATVWNSREDLDAMLASGEEPFARRLLREAGGKPEATFFDIQVEAPPGPR
jgi:hypothetical protein